jgi:PIN domain nuclease of toxin-antitoxin system
MVILDTHAWLWRANGRPLSEPAGQVIAAAPALGISPISCWEVAMLEERGRISLAIPVERWVARALVGYEVVPVTAEAAVTAGLLGRRGFHGDAADRLIYASAVQAGAQLVTRDARLRAFDPVRCIW